MFNRFIKKIANNKRGNVLTVTSLTAPVLIGFAGLSVDLGYGLYSKSQLRGATELTALDIAENYTKPNIEFVSDSVALDRQSLTTNGISVSKSALPDHHKDVAILPEDIEIGMWDVENKVFTPASTSPLVNAARVKGELSAARDNKISTFFGEMFGFSPDLRTESLALAPLIPTFHLLDPHSSGALKHSEGNGGDTSDIDIGPIWINSDADDAFIASQWSSGFGSPAAFIKGGSTLSRDKYYEQMFRLPDLIADQPEPSRPLLCDEQDFVVDKGPGKSATLEPGTYCGGLQIKSARLVTFKPGIYNFLDGPLEIKTPIDIYGNEVLFHFDGPGAAFDVDGATLRLTGLTTGPYKGFLVFSSRSTTRIGPLKTRIAHKFKHTGGEVAGLIYAPDNHVDIQRSYLDGICHSLCLVANTMTVKDGSYLNWYPTKTPSENWTKFYGKRVAPKVLEPYLSPYLISG